MNNVYCIGNYLCVIQQKLTTNTNSYQHQHYFTDKRVCIRQGEFLFRLGQKVYKSHFEIVHTWFQTAQRLRITIQKTNWLTTLIEKHWRLWVILGNYNYSYIQTAQLLSHYIWNWSLVLHKLCKMMFWYLEWRKMVVYPHSRQMDSENVPKLLL